MNRSWTFSRKLAVSFLLLAVLTVTMAVAAILILQSVLEAKDEVITRYAQNLIDAQELHFQGASKAATGRAYLLTRNRAELDMLETIRVQMLTTLEALDDRVLSPEGRQMLMGIERTEKAHQDAMRPVLEMASVGAPIEEVSKRYEQTVRPLRAELDQEIDRFVALQQKFLDEYQRRAGATASRGILLLITLAVLFGGFTTGAAFVLGRTLARQITTAVQQVESSSTELQAAAGQQASGAREQASAMNEISTTISELLATSRQIAESAQRVAHIAAETSTAARSGSQSVERSQEAIAAIRRQVDLVVGHMLDLGKKSQQIGGILEIINELAEQTNILAINATIEAVGAGETGRRFAVVADEIRKLADRVGGSTKDIRTLIDEIRASVNTTVMATEGGSKAVEAGARQIGELAAAFKQIGDLVVTTTQAANEIELSTKQQATAVEQVNVAIGNVAQTSREAETTSSQSLQTVSQLAEMSRELVRLVRAEVRV